MSGPVDVLAVLDVQCELGVKQSTKNANAGFVDWRDWCAFLGRAEEAGAAVAELIDFAKSFREWQAGTFGDFAPEVNAQLVCLDNAAEAALANIGSAS